MFSNSLPDSTPINGEENREEIAQDFEPPEKDPIDVETFSYRKNLKNFRSYNKISAEMRKMKRDENLPPKFIALMDDVLIEVEKKIFINWQFPPWYLNLKNENRTMEKCYEEYLTLEHPSLDRRLKFY